MRTGQYIIMRILAFFLQFFGAVFLMFVIFDFIPYDPLALIIWEQRPRGEEELQQLMDALNKQWGTDQPVYIQYYRFLRKLIVDRSLGTSWLGLNLDQTVRNTLPVTLSVLVIAFAIYVPLSTVLGIYAARRHHTKTDLGLNISASVLYGIPYYIYAVLFVFLADVSGLFDTYTLTSQRFLRLVVSITIIVISFTSYQYRIIRSEFIEILQRNYIRTARSKGLAEQLVIYKHALRNILPDVIISFASTIPLAISAVIVLETLIGLPGLGPVFVSTLLYVDWQVIISFSVVFILIHGSFTLITDLLVRSVDPLAEKD